MVDVAAVRATARQLPAEQLGALALRGDPLVKLGHFSLPLLLQHASDPGSFRAEMPSVQLLVLMLAIKCTDMSTRARHGDA